MASITTEPRAGKSRAWRHLQALGVGDVAPPSLYVLDYRDGERPRWAVHEVEQLGSGVRRLVLVDTDNGAWDLLDDGGRVAVQVLTWPAKTLRTQPYVLGASPGNTLCDLDQQGRAHAGQDEQAVAA